jgi:hypothetical protein
MLTFVAGFVLGAVLMFAFITWKCFAVIEKEID